MKLETGMKLEIGSGTRPRQGYLHMDINPDLVGLDYVGPMWAIPVNDDTFDEVLSVHVIEHAPRPMWLPTLREWLRVLLPGGMMQADTPNFDRNIRLYLDGGWMRDYETLTHDEQMSCSLHGEPNAALWLNFKAFSTHNEHDIHYGNLTPDLFAALCHEAGFARVEIYQTEPSLIVRAWKGEGDNAL